MDKNSFYNKKKIISHGSNFCIISGRITSVCPFKPSSAQIVLLIQNIFKPPKLIKSSSSPFFQEAVETNQTHHAVSHQA